VELLNRGAIVNDRIITNAQTSGNMNLVNLLMDQIKIYDSKLIEACLAGNVQSARSLIGKYHRISNDTVSQLLSQEKYETLRIIIEYGSDINPHIPNLIKRHFEHRHELGP
jgi:hypothetical protein